MRKPSFFLYYCTDIKKTTQGLVKKMSSDDYEFKQKVITKGSGMGGSSIISGIKARTIKWGNANMDGKSHERRTSSVDGRIHPLVLSESVQVDVGDFSD